MEFEWCENKFIFVRSTDLMHIPMCENEEGEEKYAFARAQLSYQGLQERRIQFLGRYLTRMSTASNVGQLFLDKVCQQLPASLSTKVVDEEEVATHLREMLVSILTSHSYTHENQTTLDYSTPNSEFDGCVEDPDNPSQDPDYEEDDRETPVFECFSLSYMKRALEYYDDVNPKTGKSRHTWNNVKHQFQRIPYQYYLHNFCKYVEHGGTKKQKVDSVDDFVYHKFEYARDLLCPVHDIDLRRWAHQQARSMSFNEFAASDTWLLNFKQKHDICSRKITKVSLNGHWRHEDGTTF